VLPRGPSRLDGAYITAGDRREIRGGSERLDEGDDDDDVAIGLYVDEDAGGQRQSAAVSLPVVQLAVAGAGCRS